MYCCLFRMNRFMHSYMSKTVRFSMKGLETKLSFVRLSPFFAVLSVVRQATDNFSLQQASNEILSLLGAFKKQWEEFVKKLDVLGKRLSDAMDEYDSLNTTRRRQLEKPLNKIEDLRKQRGLPVAPVEDKSMSTLGEDEV